jgi:hypothetical protein
LTNRVGFTSCYYKTVTADTITWIPITAAHTTGTDDVFFARDTPIDEYFETGLRSLDKEEPVDEDECDE